MKGMVSKHRSTDSECLNYFSGGGQADDEDMRSIEYAKSVEIYTTSSEKE